MNAQPSSLHLDEVVGNYKAQSRLAKRLSAVRKALKEVEPALRDSLAHVDGAAISVGGVNLALKPRRVSRPKPRAKEYGAVVEELKALLAAVAATGGCDVDGAAREIYDTVVAPPPASRTPSKEVPETRVAVTVDDDEEADEAAAAFSDGEY